jgi:hypothetical protein
MSTLRFSICDIDVVVSVFLLGPPAVFSLLAQVPCAAAGTHR